MSEFESDFEWTDDMIEALAQHRAWIERADRLFPGGARTIPSDVNLKIATRELEILKAVDPTLWARRERVTRFEALARAGRVSTIPGSMASWLRARGYGDALIEVGHGTAVDLEHPCVDEHLRALVTRRPPPDNPSRCHQCGGEIGPDVTDRPMCYDCGPYELLPTTARTPKRAARNSCFPSLLEGAR